MVSTAAGASEPAIEAERSVVPTKWARSRPLVLAAAGYLILSLLAWSNVWINHPSTTTTCGCGDASTTLWYLAWPAYAISHGANPFFTTALHYPTGVNLLSNTSVLAVGVPLAPITWLFGPVATLNVALTLVPVLNALAMYVLIRRWTAWAPASFIGGLFYGFSPFVIESLSQAHLMLGLLVVPPLVVLCLDELFFRRRRSAVTAGIALGLLIVLQFFIGTEVLLAMAIMGVIGVALVAVYCALTARDAFVGHLPRTVIGLGCGAVTALVLLAYPAWFALDGPGHLSGRIWPGGLTANAVPRDFLVPNQAVGGAGSSYFNHILGGYQGIPISPLYLGIGVVAVGVAGLVRWRRDHRLWLFAAVALVSVLLAFGSPTGVPTPWKLFQNLDVVENILPARFVLFAVLAFAIMLGVSVDHAHAGVERWRVARAARTAAEPQLHPELPRWSAGLAALVIAAVALVPPALYVTRTMPYTIRPVVLPTWFRTVAPGLDQSDVVLVIPAAFSYTKSPIAWQAVTGMTFSMVGQGGPSAVLTRAGHERAGQAVLAQVSAFPHDLRPYATAKSVSAVRHAIDGWGVTSVVIPDQPSLPPYAYGYAGSVTFAAALITAATGERPVYQAEAWVWKGVDNDGPARIPKGTRLLECTKGLPTQGVAAVTSATRCALGRGPHIS